jgi:hypothetical protein
MRSTESSRHQPRLREATIPVKTLIFASFFGHASPPLVRLLTSFAIDIHTLAKSIVKPIREWQKRDAREHIACRARIVDTQASNNVHEMRNHNVRLPNHYS